jgi:hypothetical protein
MDKDLLGRPIKAKPEIGGGKCCIICGEYKYLEEFDKHTGHKDNRDGRCRECKREQVKLRKELMKTAPSKPDTCDCCGKTYETRLITLDHCHETNVFRGWICHYCNAGIGQLGDNIQGLEQALQYLRRHYASI